MYMAWATLAAWLGLVALNKMHWRRLDDLHTAEATVLAVLILVVLGITARGCLG